MTAGLVTNGFKEFESLRYVIVQTALLLVSEHNSTLTLIITSYYLQGMDRQCLQDIPYENRFISSPDKNRSSRQELVPLNTSRDSSRRESHSRQVLCDP